ncbi:Bestrophin/UPF0187 family-containing protein [Aphelenchoides besseyi]|nr:Bestrophin/UPF0187 family-containing protein [Aphelenchoides besseyi]
MTVSYNCDANTWRASVWKSIAWDVIVWSSAYVLINVFLRQFCNDSQQANFKLFQTNLSERMKSYPMVFMLGFFSNVIFNRWVSIFQYIGFVDSLALAVASNVKGTDTETRILKRNIIRYCVLSQSLLFRDISLQARKRFPDVESLIDCGLMTTTEHDIYVARNLPISKFWIPIQWALNLVVKAREDGKIVADMVMWNIQEKIRDFRNNLHKLAQYDWVPVPLAYSQIIWIAIRCYFGLTLITAQILVGKDFPLLGFPYVALIEFILMSGWVNVAAVLINPFGLADDHFEVNAIIDRNLTTGLAIVDNTHFPVQEVDPFWSFSNPIIPLDSMVKSPGLSHRNRPYEGSVADLDMSRTTNDVNYQLNRARRRTLIKQMTTMNDSAFSTPVNGGRFCDTRSQRFGSLRQSQLSTDFPKPSPFHQLCRVCESLEENSRHTSASTSRASAEPIAEVQSINTEIPVFAKTPDIEVVDEEEAKCFKNK